MACGSTVGSWLLSRGGQKRERKTTGIIFLLCVVLLKTVGFKCFHTDIKKSK
jgi:hypothetical protein